MNRYARRPRTQIQDLDSTRTIQPLTDRELELASGGAPGRCIPKTTNVDGAGATDDVSHP